MKLELVRTEGARTAVRLSGRAVFALVVVLSVFMLVRLVGFAFDLDAAVHWPMLARGAKLTIMITLVTYCAGFVIACFAVAGRVVRNRLVNRSCALFGYVFRGTPLLVQLYLIYYGSGELGDFLRSVGAWWFFRDPLNCVLLAFTLNTAAYQAEVMYGALRAVPIGQQEAARSLGLSALQTYRKVLVPQALLLAVRPMGNELAKMLKASAIASLVTVVDLLAAAKLIYSETFNFDIFLLIAIAYILSVELMRAGIEALDCRLRRYQRPGADVGGPVPIETSLRPRSPLAGMVLNRF